MVSAFTNGTRLMRIALLAENIYKCGSKVNVKRICWSFELLYDIRIMLLPANTTFKTCNNEKSVLSPQKLQDGDLNNLSLLYSNEIVCNT